MNIYTRQILAIAITTLLFTTNSGITIAQNYYQVQRGERPPINLERISDDAFEPGKIKIKLRESLKGFERFRKIQAIDSAYVATGYESLDALNSRYGVRTMKPVFAALYETRSATSGFTDRHEAWGFHLWYELIMDEKKDVKKAVSEYLAIKEVEFAEPEYKKRAIADNMTLSMSPGTTGILTGSKWQPNDPRFNEQWHYHNTGQQNGSPGADISLKDAWDIEKGNPAIVVAIIDDGIQFNHPDLAGNMWQNALGHYGYNFVNNTATINPGNHGTHVAGTVAAVTNNGTGVAGIAGGSGSGDGVRLMSCQVFGSSSNGGFHLAPVYAADNGAAISQNSWGYTSPGVYDQNVLDAIDYFNANGGGSVMNGGITIFAAGNDNSSSNYYPAFYSGCLSVAGTNNQDQKSWYSNYGSWIDISAPGGETNTVSARGVLSTVTGNSYAFYQGTSMACPHVSGVAALLLSNANRNNVTLSNADLWELLIENIDNHYPQNPSFSGQLGSGRLNANLALQALQNLISGVMNPANFTATAISTSQINLGWFRNNNDHNVMLVWSATGIFGTPDQGTAYAVGSVLPGGGVVIYSGSNTAYSHTNLEPSTPYYYKAFSYNTLNEYSSGTSTQATTFCDVINTLPLIENFNASTAIPVCWEVLDHQGNGQIWRFGTHPSGLSGTTGNYAYLDSDSYGNNNSQNSDLVSPVLDLSGYVGVNLSFTHYFRQYLSVSAARLFYSIDGGSNWSQIAQWTSTTSNPAIFNQPVPQVNGQANVRFKWNYTGTWGYYWDVDDIQINGIASGPYADFVADPTSAIIGETIIFTDASGGGSFSTWQWNFGDGANPATASGQGPHAVTYYSIGKKSVSLLVDETYSSIKADYITIAPTTNAVSSTYTQGDAPTDKAFISLPGSSSCPATLVVSIPLGSTITGTDVTYQMTAWNYGWKSEQRSQLRCISPGGIAESPLYSGSENTGGTQFYERNGLDIANNVTGGGDILFQLHAGRTWGGTGCGTEYNKVDNHSWTVTVHYIPPLNLPPDESLSVHCITEAVEPEPPNLTDACGESIIPVLISIIDDPNPLTCAGTRIYTYLYTDCQQSSGEWHFTYYILENDSPFLIDENIDCSSLNQQNLNWSLEEAESFNPGSLEIEIAALYNDNCGEVLVSYVETIADAGNTNSNWSLNFLFVVSDACLNVVTCIVNYSGGLTGGLTLVDENVDCSSLNNFNLNWCLSEATAFDPASLESSVADLYTSVCGETTATLTDALIGEENDDCAWSYTFVYEVSDLCLNVVTCFVNYYGGDAEPPFVADGNPETSSLDQHGLNLCLAEAESIDPHAYETQVAALFNDNCSEVSATFFETIHGSENNDCGWTLTFAFHVSDQCMNTLTYLVTLSGSDADAPTLADSAITSESLNQNNLNYCLEDALAFNPTTLEESIAALYTDNCSEVLVSFLNDDVSGTDCQWSIVYNFEVSDACDNTVSCQVSFTGGSQQAPEWEQIILPENSTVSCNAIPPPVTLAATDFCGNPVSIVFEETRNNGNCEHNYTLVRTWTATDACGLSISHTQTINVEDIQPPALIDPEVSCASLDQNNLPWSFAEAGNFDANNLLADVAALFTDNCGNLSAMLLGSNISGSNENWLAEFFFIISDECGNESECTVSYSGGFNVPDHIELNQITAESGDTLCFGSTQTISVQQLLVQEGGKIKLIAGESVSFSNDIVVQVGGGLHAYISNIYCENPSPVVAYKELKEEQKASFVSFGENESFFTIYPNPTIGSFTVELAEPDTNFPASVEIYNFAGAKISSEEFYGNRKMIIDLGTAPKGLYLVRLLYGKRLGVEKLIKH